MAGLYQADYLTSADQATSDWLVQDSISGRVETIINLSLVWWHKA